LIFPITCLTLSLNFILRTTFRSIGLQNFINFVATRRVRNISDVWRTVSNLISLLIVMHSHLAIFLILFFGNVNIQLSLNMFSIFQRFQVLRQNIIILATQNLQSPLTILKIQIVLIHYCLFNMIHVWGRTTVLIDYVHDIRYHVSFTVRS